MVELTWLNLERDNYLRSFLVSHKGTGGSFRDSVQLSSKVVNSLDEKSLKFSTSWASESCVGITGDLTVKTTINHSKKLFSIRVSNFLLVVTTLG